jgi:hypothetical protein
MWTLVESTFINLRLPPVCVYLSGSFVQAAAAAGVYCVQHERQQTGTQAK